MIAGFAIAKPSDAHPDRQVLRMHRGPGGEYRLDATYDAARTTPDNRNHWAQADILAANAAANPFVRNTVRSRARYEVANNTYAQGIVDTLADWTIGSGPTLQLIGPDQTAATRIEDRFTKWAKAVKLGRKLWTMRRAKCVDGESFAIEITNDRLPTEVKADFCLFEADQVATPGFTGFLDGPNKTDGIVFDDAGNPIEYHLLKNHPGNNYGGTSLEYDKIPAERVIHLFKLCRPGQSRGVSEIITALSIFPALRRYSDAVLGAAEAAADWAIILKSTAPANDEDVEEVAALSEIELTPRMMTMAPYGTDPQMMRAEQPTTQYPAYFSTKICEIARCVNMPLNIALGSSKDMNYASGRLDTQTFFRTIKIEQKNIEDDLDAHVWAAWSREDRLIHPVDYAAGEVATKWTWPGYEHVDPNKEANAQDTRLKNLTTTHAEEYARNGADWERAFEQRQIEQKKKLGLDLDLAVYRRDEMKKRNLTEDEVQKVLPQYERAKTATPTPDQPPEPEDGEPAGEDQE